MMKPTIENQPMMNTALIAQLGSNQSRVINKRFCIGQIHWLSPAVVVINHRLLTSRHYMISLNDECNLKGNIFSVESC